MKHFTCYTCKKNLPADSFAKDRSNHKTGLQGRCRSCCSQRYKDRVKERAAVVSVDKKQCSRCGNEFDISMFYSNPISLDGYGWWCKDCSKLGRIYTTYKITPEQYNAMSANGCQIEDCGSYEDLHIDHDHSCCPGYKSCGDCIRGILCVHHNQGLGRFNDDPATLRNAAKYLEDYAKRKSLTRRNRPTTMEA